MLHLAATISVCLALLCTGSRPLRQLAFTLWIIASFLTALATPHYFLNWGSFDLKNAIVPLVQLIMFGIGTTLTLSDFRLAIQRPKPILLSIALQFVFMPLVAFTIVKVLAFDPEVAVGLILLGACSGGMASNLIAYLARGDLALSVTMTCCSTCLAPIFTPLALKIYAGRMVPVPFFEMMLSIVSMIILPIVAGLIAHPLLYSKRPWSNSIPKLFFVAAMCVLGSLLLLTLNNSIARGVGFCLVLLSSAALVKLLVVALQKPASSIERLLPTLSMVSICASIVLITARSHETLQQVGILLVVASVLHNVIGYFGGYWAARLCGFSQRECRTISIEVGFQNGGMATGLAIDVLQSAHAALAPTIFGAWQNVSGSLLAMFWGRHPTGEISEQVASEERMSVALSSDSAT